MPVLRLLAASQTALDIVHLAVDEEVKRGTLNENLPDAGIEGKF